VLTNIFSGFTLSGDVVRQILLLQFVITFASMLSDDKLQSQLEKDILTCAIYCSQYKDPRALKCKHTFCSACLKGKTSYMLTIFKWRASVVGLMRVCWRNYL